nr:MAG TPA: hypothetical protein [Caudoviricetes sp.]
MAIPNTGIYKFKQTLLPPFQQCLFNQHCIVLKPL